jgi:putative aminopeptidase FrvX
MDLLKKLCNIHAPSGNEEAMTQFLLSYIDKEKHKWSISPEIFQGEDLQNCIVLKFGNPRTAVFAHMDSIGFTVRYENQLIPIGGPDAQTGYHLKGEDLLGEVRCTLKEEEGNLYYDFGRAISRGTNLTFECDFRETKEYVQSCYLDNRLGVYNALKLAETLQNGVIVFSCWEEHGGGSVPFLAKFIYEKWGIKQALISDITWVTGGVTHGKGVAISMRDYSIPRKSFVDKIVSVAHKHQVPYQLEVESSGASDGRELQASPYPIDWCFIGAPEDNVHTPNEIVHKSDIASMLHLYELLMAEI